MNTFIHRMRKWLKGFRRVSPRQAPDQQPAPATPVRFAVLPEFTEWTSEDILKLRAFLGSETGQKLVKVCGSAIHVEAMAESAGDRAGKKAFGMDAMLRFQFNLASDKEFARATDDSGQKLDTTGAELNDGLPVEFRRSF